MSMTQFLKNEEIGQKLKELCKNASSNVWISTYSIANGVEDIDFIKTVLCLRRQADVRILTAPMPNSCVSGKSLEFLWNKFHSKQSCKIRQASERFHAKIYLIDNNAVISSANLSSNALNGEQTEIAVLIENNNLIKEMKDWYRDLWDNGSEEITKQNVEEQKKQKRPRSDFNSNTPKVGYKLNWPTSSNFKLREIKKNHPDLGLFSSINNERLKELKTKFKKYYSKTYPEIQNDSFSLGKLLENKGFDEGYKVKAVNRGLETLTQEKFHNEYLKTPQKFIEIFGRVISFENNLVLNNRFQAMHWQEDTKTLQEDDTLSNKFCNGIYDLLYGKTPEIKRIDGFYQFLKENKDRFGLGLWNYLTYPLFVRYPEKHYFVQPKAIEAVARYLGYELKVSRNCSTKAYFDVLKFIYTLAINLQDWKPKDMLDMQTFVWLSAQDVL